MAIYFTIFLFNLFTSINYFFSTFMLKKLLYWVASQLPNPKQTFGPRNISAFILSLRSAFRSRIRIRRGGGSCCARTGRTCCASAMRCSMWARERRRTSPSCSCRWRPPPPPPPMCSCSWTTRTRRRRRPSACACATSSNAWAHGEAQQMISTKICVDNNNAYSLEK